MLDLIVAESFAVVYISDQAGMKVGLHVHLSGGGSIGMQIRTTVISRLDSQTLRPVNVPGLLVFSNNIKNGIS